VLRVEPRRAAHVQPPQRPVRVRVRRLDEQMVMVLHQHVRVQDHAVAPGHLRQKLNEMLPVAVAAEDRPPPHPAGRDVIPSARSVMPQLSGHAATIPKSTQPRNRHL